MESVVLVDSVKKPKIKIWLFVVFYMLGLTSLIPWNFYMVSKRYFDYAFRNLNSTNTTSSLQNSFESYLSFITHIASILIVIWNAVQGYKFSLTKRLVVSLVAQILLFAVILVFVHVDTDSWQNGFFILTMVLATLTIGIANIFQCTLLGLLAKFPATYTNAAMSSQGIAGVLPSLADVISILVSQDPKLDAIIYFAIVMVALVIGIGTYYILFKYELNVKTFSSLDGTINDYMYENTELYQQMSFRSILSTFKLTTRFQLLLFYNFVVTFAVFPGVVASVESLHHGSIFYDKIFVSIMCFLVFNVGDFLGRTLCEYVNWPKVSSLSFTILCALRTVFIPLFLMCNIQPHLSNMPVLFGDWWYLGFMLAFSITNGYFITKIMIYAPRSVDAKLAELTGQLIQVSLIFGILIGSLISLILVKI